MDSVALLEVCMALPGLKVRMGCPPVLVSRAPPPQSSCFPCDSWMIQKGSSRSTGFCALSRRCAALTEPPMLSIMQQLLSLPVLLGSMALTPAATPLQQALYQRVAHQSPALSPAASHNCWRFLPAMTCALHSLSVVPKKLH